MTLKNVEPAKRILDVFAAAGPGEELAKFFAPGVGPVNYDCFEPF